MINNREGERLANSLALGSLIPAVSARRGRRRAEGCSSAVKTRSFFISRCNKVPVMLMKGAKVGSICSRRQSAVFHVLMAAALERDTSLINGGTRPGREETQGLPAD